MYVYIQYSSFQTQYVFVIHYQSVKKSFEHAIDNEYEKKETHEVFLSKLSHVVYVRTRIRYKI